MSAAAGRGEKVDGVAAAHPRLQVLLQADVLAVDQDHGPGQQPLLPVEQFVQEILPGFLFRQEQQFQYRQLRGFDFDGRRPQPAGAAARRT